MVKSFKIAISGKANSGKNTLTSIIYEELSKTHSIQGCDFKNMAFADPIKEMVLMMYPQAQRHHLFGESVFRSSFIPGSNVTYRQALLDIGKLGRNHDNNLWVSNLKYRLKEYNEKQIKNNSSSIIIISDLRFINEVDYLENEGFYLVRLKRKNNQLKINDISEKEQDSIPDSKFNTIISNDQDLYYLRQEVITKIVANIK